MMYRTTPLISSLFPSLHTSVNNVLPSYSCRFTNIYVLLQSLPSVSDNISKSRKIFISTPPYTVSRHINFTISLHLYSTLISIFLLRLQVLSSVQDSRPFYRIVRLAFPLLLFFRLRISSQTVTFGN